MGLPCQGAEAEARSRKLQPGDEIHQENVVSVEDWLVRAPGFGIQESVRILD